MRIASRVRGHDRAVGVELAGELRSQHRRALLVLRALVVAAAGHDAGEAQALTVHGEQLAHERRTLEVVGRVAETRPVVLARRERPVEDLERVEDGRLEAVEGGAVEVDLVQRAERGELEQQRDRGEVRQPVAPPSS